MPAPPSSTMVTGKPTRAARIRDLLPDIIAIVAPRRWILLIGFILIMATRLASMAPAWAMKRLIDDVLGKGLAEKLPMIIAIVVGATLFNQIVSFTLTRIFSRSTTRMIGDVRCRLEAHVLRLSLTYHDTHKSGAVGSHVMNDVQGLQNLVGTGILSYVGALMMSAIALVFMARLNLLLTAISLVALIGVGGLISIMTKRVREIALARTRIFAELMGRLTEALGGVRVVKAYRAEDREDAIFAAGCQRVIDNSLQSVDLTTGLNLGTGMLWGLAGAAVMWVAVNRILEHKLTLGEWMMFSYLAGMAMAPVTAIINMGTMIMEALAGLERTRDIFNEPREDHDPQRTVAIGPLRGEIAFDDVDFEYKAGRAVLHGVSFRAPSGTVTALVGPSGSGKSTTIGIIASFYKPVRGTVTVDGIDLSTVKIQTYRSQLGLVLQDTFLFAGTILENVAFARPEATLEQILGACRTARVDEFAERFEHKYDTVIGERGVMLSGGQRQRISIARALLADPRILILDEATSSLDSHSEALIQEGLSHLLEGRTTFVIAHRLSTIRKAHQILVVDQGRIVERGSHAELIAKHGVYEDMYTKQHHLAEDLFLAPGEGGAQEAMSKPMLSATAIEDPVAIVAPT